MVEDMLEKETLNYQELNHLVHHLAVLKDRLLAVLVRLRHEQLDLVVDRRRTRVRRPRVTEGVSAVGALPCDRAEGLLGVAPLRHHAPGDVAHLLQVARSARRHLLSTEDDLLHDAAAERHRELALEVSLRVHAALEALLRRREESEAAGAVGA